MESSVETIIKSLIAVAWMDGRIAEEEMGVVDAIIDSFKLDAQDKHALRQYARYPHSLGEISLTDLSSDQRRELLQQAVVLTFVDGEQTEDENRVISYLIEKLEMSKDEADKIVSAAQERAKRMLSLL